MFSQSLSLDWRNILYLGDDAPDLFDSFESNRLSELSPDNSSERFISASYSPCEFDCDVPF